MSLMYTDLDGKETKGEKLVYELLMSELPDDYHIWHNLIIPKADKEVDFIILHPTFGIWVIEVKDWIIDQILEADSKYCLIIKDNKQINFPNPIWQARKNFIALKELLQKEDSLTHKIGNHKGKVIVPINYLVIFTNISNEDIMQKGLLDIFPEDKIIPSEYLLKNYMPQDEWQKLLLNKRTIKFLNEEPLERKQIDLIKYKINPSARVISINTSELLGTLDNNQVKLTEKDLDKQIIIEGPAGSGKSIVLFKRALQIKKNYPEWKVLLICYNKLMANYLRTLSIIEQEIKEESEKYGQIEIYDIYDWAHKVGLKNVLNYYSSVDTPEKALEKALEEKNGNVDYKYDAVLVDEGHDSKEIYIKIFKSMLKNDNSSFTFCYDKKQVLYTGCDFINDDLIKYLNQKGFKIDKKEKRLVNQYRTAPFLLKIAIAFRERYLGVEWKDPALRQLFSGIFDRIFNFFRNRDNTYNIKGKINLYNFETIEDMVKDIVSVIERKTKESNYTWSDFLIIYPSRKLLALNSKNLIFIEDVISDIFTKANLEYVIVKNVGRYDNSRNVNLSENQIKVMTIHCSKGYDAREVFIVGFDNIENDEFLKFPSNLGYVGITRARETTNIYYSVRNKSISILEEVIQKFDPNFKPKMNLPDKFQIPWKKFKGETVII